MYLKRLDLTGFKTFAGHTEFVFNSGVTAIIGPNGCGKSNVADAIRWVLGEQSVRWLRAKKAEDLIYAGSAGRAALGMAEVTMTLDNSQGWLAIPYGEVAITRRAYRSGENEYLINRQRVRHRDIAEMLARTGLGPGGYSVIGQGMIDQVLSLRPEERRALFEDAANIRHFYNKLNEARSRLDQTEQNSLRVNDLIAEIKPRLGALEVQARHAEQHSTVKEELFHLLEIYYRDLWMKMSQALEEAVGRETDAGQRLLEQQDALDRTSAHLKKVREGQSETRARLSLWRDRYSNLRTSHDDVRRRLAVNKERLSSHQIQIEDVSQEITTLTEQIAIETGRLSGAETLMAEMSIEHGKLLSALASAEKRVEAKQRERQEALSHLSTLHSDNLRINTGMAEFRSKLSHASQRRATLQSELARHQATEQQQATQIKHLQIESETELQGMTQLQDEESQADLRWQQTQRMLSQSLATQQQTGEVVADLSRLTQELSTRNDLIGRWEQSYSGYFAGVKTVLQVSRQGTGGTRLSGIVGVVGKLIQSPPEMETAIEVALGSHVQDIVVERWEDAEKAITLLKRTSGGRATFLPLDTIHRQTRSDSIHRGPGVLGIASELVSYEPRFQAIVSHLLGHTIVVQDLAVARRTLAHCSPGWQIVTLGGEVVRAGGTITGGSMTTSSGILSRQRELRELPAKLAETEVQLSKARAKLASEKQRHQELLANLANLETSRKHISTTLQSRARHHRDLENTLQRLRTEGDWAREREQQVLREIEDLRKTELSWQEEIERLTADNETALQIVETTQGNAEQLREQEESLSAKTHEIKTSVALAGHRIQTQQEAVERLRSSIASTEKRIEFKKSRLSELSASTETLTQEITSAESDLGSLAREMESLSGVMQPAERNLLQMEAEQSGLLAEEAACRAAIQDTQAQAARMAIEVQKARDDLETLKIRIEGELGSAAFLVEEDGAPADPGVNMDEVKRRISVLRDQMRKMPQVNPRAVEDYQEALERHRFLGEQVADLQHGAASLNHIIDELQKTMAQRFEETFHAVAKEFQRYFNVLFGGGAAKLTLTDPGNITNTGVEIIAQPPGKKPQILSLLSGGERALTAAALLFAILRVNPSPVCVLDEVDAALDEANISRFCSTLQDLAKNTQFIVITHNRGTMEIAETLYGISMPENSISRVVSLRFSGEEAGEPAHQSQFATAS